MDEIHINEINNGFLVRTFNKTIYAKEPKDVGNVVEQLIKDYLTEQVARKRKAE